MHAIGLVPRSKPIYLGRQWNREQLPITTSLPHCISNVLKKVINLNR